MNRNRMNHNRRGCPQLKGMTSNEKAWNLNESRYSPKTFQNHYAAKAPKNKAWIFWPGAIGLLLRLSGAVHANRRKTQGQELVLKIYREQKRIKIDRANLHRAEAVYQCPDEKAGETKSTVP